MWNCTGTVLAYGLCCIEGILTGRLVSFWLVLPITDPMNMPIMDGDPLLKLLLHLRCVMVQIILLSPKWLGPLELAVFV